MAPGAVEKKKKLAGGDLMAPQFSSPSQRRGAPTTRALHPRREESARLSPSHLALGSGGPWQEQGEPRSSLGPGPLASCATPGAGHCTSLSLNSTTVSPLFPNFLGGRWGELGGGGRQVAQKKMKGGMPRTG